MTYLVSYYFLTYTLVSQNRYTPYSGVLKTELYYLQDLSLYFISSIKFVQILEIELIKRAGFILLLSLVNSVSIFISLMKIIRRHH